MQPNDDPVGDLKTNGPAPSAVAAEMPDSRVNGGASPELLDLLNALQSMRVGDFSVRMSGSQVGLLGKSWPPTNAWRSSSSASAKSWAAKERRASG
jgi:hypothetical protein